MRTTSLLFSLSFATLLLACGDKDEATDDSAVDDTNAEGDADTDADADTDTDTDADTDTDRGEPLARFELTGSERRWLGDFGPIRELPDLFELRIRGEGTDRQGRARAFDPQARSARPYKSVISKTWCRALRGSRRRRSLVTIATC